MTARQVRHGEVAVLGLGKSGSAVARLLLSRGNRVYVSDGGQSPQLATAAESLRDRGAAVDVGKHDIDRILNAAYVVVSPGIPPEAEPLARARSAEVPVVSEIEIALRHLPDSRVIAVTGTNGKTTTTALVGHLLRGIGAEAIDAGNIGLPLSEVAMRAQHPRWIALEMSSFQLHDTPGLNPTVGVLTNLSPDHLDRYPSEEEYYADKARLFANADSRSRWVLNGDDPRVGAMSAGIEGARYCFSLRDPADAWYDRPSDALVVRRERMIGRTELTLLGDHNVANALAAALAVSVADDRFWEPESRSRLAAALRSFASLPNRMEVVGEFDGVLWINDSKATNVSSSLVAVAGMRRPTILLLGGRHKGEPYTALVAAIRKNVRHVLAFGEAGDIVYSDLSAMTDVEVIRGSFETVMARARELARPGDAVLLSPACSSYDMFRNYEERGQRFRELARAGAAAGTLSGTARSPEADDRCRGIHA